VEALTQHLTLTAVSVLIGLVLSVPLAVLARRAHLSQLLLGAATVVYTIPSVALFSLFIPFTGISATTVVIGLVLYSLTVLVRNALAGLDGVPLPGAEPVGTIGVHANVRGASYYE